MPLDAPSTLLEARSIKLSALLDSGLPLTAADPIADTPAPAADSAAAMRAVAGNVVIDENLQATVGPLPTFRTPLEVATFFIGVKYSEMGGAAGLLGSTSSAVSLCPDGVGFYRHFQMGSIYWHPATGAHEVHGEIRWKWAALGWERSMLGYPMSDETVGHDAAGAGRFNRFQNGAIYWYPDGGTQVALTSTVATARLAGRTAQPSVTATLSSPIVGDRIITTGPGIPIVPSTAHEVHGAIAAKYRMLGAESSFLGYPTTDESATPDGSGRYNHFQAGSIYWTPGTGASEVHGLIRDYWAAHGWERNPDLGYPISDELIPDRRIGHSRPDPIRKPVPSLPVDRIKLPAEAAALGFPRTVVNVPATGTVAKGSVLDLPTTVSTGSVIVGSIVIGPIISSEPDVPFPGHPLSTTAPEASRNRFGDFENGVLFWRRGDTVAQPLAPWSAAADGTSMRLTAGDIIHAVQPRISQALGNLTDVALASITFLGTTGYSFDGVGVHNRRHRLQLTFMGTRQIGLFPQPVQATFEVQVEATYEPIERIVTGQIVDWRPLSVPGSLFGLSRQLRTALDPILWSAFTLLQLPDTNAGAPIAVLSVKTMGNGDVNVYIES